MERITQNTLHRSEALSRERLRELIGWHETAADDLSATLSSLLRRSVEVSHRDTLQTPYGDFLARLGNTTYIHLLRAASDDVMLLEIELPVLYPMIDRLLGGCSEDEQPPRRPLSDIEKPLAARLVRSIVQHLPPARNDDESRKIELDRVESNPRLIRAMPMDELVVAVEFQVAVGSRRGMMRLCVPCRTVQPTEIGVSSEINTDHTGDYRPQNDAVVDSTSSVEVHVTLASTPITAAELTSLRVGDIVATETSADEPAVVSLCGEPKYLAKPGACRSRKAVRITSPIRNETN